MRVSSRTGGTSPTRATRLATLLAAVVLALGLVAAGCGGDEDGGNGGAAADEEGESTEPREVAEGEPFEYEGTDPEQAPVQFKGWVPGNKASEEYKIGYFAFSPINTYVQAMHYGADTADDALGVEVTTTINEWDGSQQLNQLQTAIQQQQYDGIVIAPTDPNVVCRVLTDLAPEMDVPVVVTNFPICGDGAYTEGTVGLSSSQSLDFYQEYADWAFGWLSENGGGKVGAITGPPEGGHAILIQQAYEEADAKYDNVEVAQVISDDFTAEAGLAQTQTLIQTHPDLDMIVSSYDQNTVGAVQALEAAGKQPGDITMFSLGGDHASIPLMEEGWIEGMAYLEPITEVAQGVEMMVAHLEGVEVPTFNNLGDGSGLAPDTVEMTKENMDEFIPQF